MSVVSVSREINTSKSALWQLISSEGNLEKFHPFCKKNEVISWSGKTSEDKLTYLNNRTFIRKWNSWEENNGYTLTISNTRFSADVDWSITGNTKKSSITISIRPNFLPNNPIAQWFAFNLLIKHRLRNYLDHVLTGLDDFLVNDTAIRTNQYGVHPWFS